MPVLFSPFRNPAVRFVIELVDRLAQTNMMLVAAGVTFYAMLAVFPGLSATLAIWSTFADPEAIRSYLSVAHTFIPPEAFEILSQQIDALMQGPRGGIGLPAVVSILIALWSARAGVGSLLQGLNLIHGTRPRNTVLAYLFGYVMTVALVGVMLLALATVVVVPVVVTFLPFHAVTGWLNSGLPWIAMVLLMFTALGLLYRYGPNVRPDRRDPFVSAGSFLATLVWGGASLGLTFYIANFGNYNRIYGSIGAVIALMMWLYVSAMSVLLGAALNAEIARWRLRRTRRRMAAAQRAARRTARDLARPEQGAAEQGAPLAPRLPPVQ